MSSKVFASALMAAVLLAGCQSLQDNPKQAGGTLLGGALGALAGSQIGGGKGQLAAVAVGALAGAWLGSEVGKSLDNADRAALQQTTQKTLEYSPTGASSAWSNPDSGHSGTVTPVRTFQAASGGDCREYETTVNIDGKVERAVGTACRGSDGVWRVQN